MKKVENYQPLVIEAKWQKKWRQEKLYEVDLKAASDAGKFYAFGMFNYASGAGIHVGHVRNFLIPDVLLRVKRQQGVAVYAPVGFDSFGLPTENYALKTGTPPRQVTDEAIANYNQQYETCGFSFDWSKVIDTSQPLYYRWTQWCFLQLYKAGLAYRKTSSQFWCDSCKTVLADEQVINGKCWRHDGSKDPLIGRKYLKQWFFKITDYAAEILEATQDLNWTAWVKTTQQNYIGRSAGFEINFSLQGLDLDSKPLTVFTTALETIEGATFLVLAPEHPLCSEIVKKAGNKDEIEAYIKRAEAKSEVSRQQAKEKTGLLVQGLKALNPATRREMTVWIADYVLVGYGTGAIMAVPGNDERDFVFAEKYELPIIYTTTDQEFVAYKDIASSPGSYYNFNRPKETMADSKQVLFKQLKAKKVAKEKVNYKLRDWLISRQRYWGAPIPIIHCQDCGEVPVPESDLPVELPVIKDYKPAGDGRSPLAKAQDWLQAVCPKCQKPAQRETDTMDGYVCSSWYQMRYLSPHSTEVAWDKQILEKWFPVDFYNGGDHATAHLIYARFFTRFFYRQKLVPDPEPFKQMYLHAKILAPDGQFFSKSKGNGINPLDIIEQGYGADALRVYICYIAPPDTEAVWDHHGVPAAYRFLRRVWVLVENYLRQKYIKPVDTFNQRLLQASHRCLAKNNEDIERLKYNTALAAQMELVNTLYGLAEVDKFQSSAWQQSLEILVAVLAPFAPHLASELWQRLGHSQSVHLNKWPKLQTQYLVEEKTTIALQVDGKLRGEIRTNTDSPEEVVVEQANQLSSLTSSLEGREILKTVYVPNKILNFVTKSK